MTKVSTLGVLKNLPNKPDENELAMVINENSLYQYKEAEGGWVKFQPPSGELNLSLYDINKNAMAQLTPLNKTQKEKKKDILNTFIEDTNNSYYMALIKDMGYYTLFLLEDAELSPFVDEFYDCISDVGELLDFSYEKENGAVEFWVKHDDTSSVGYLFPYDRGVVKCKKH